MTTNAATWGAGNSQQRGVLSVLRQAVAAYRLIRAKRRTAATLAELDDHTLRDIGVDPSTVRPLHRPTTEWVLQSNSGTARLVFIGR